jgi:hypothetical protein
VGGWIDLSSSPAGTMLMLSVPLEQARHTAQGDDTATDTGTGTGPGDDEAWG